MSGRKYTMQEILAAPSINEPCSACGDDIWQDETGEPAIAFKAIVLCSACAIELIEPIYSLGGCGALQPFIFKDLLTSTHHRKRRSTIKDYRRIFKELLHKYKFQCVSCGEREEKKLTIDHIKPVSKGGTNDYENLQILCKSCNSSKGAKNAKEWQR